MTNRDNNVESRRDFLKTGAAAAVGAAALSGTSRAAIQRAARRAAPRSTTPVVISFFLRGGADAVNMIAPTGEADYYVHRPTVAVPAPGTGSGVDGLALDATFSMHPGLAGLHTAYTAPASNVAIVHACGINPSSRSHFDAQDIYEGGGDISQFGDGWINRHLQATATGSDAPVRAVALRGSTPRITRGDYPTFAVQSVDELSLSNAAPDLLSTLDTIVQRPATGQHRSRRIVYQGMVETFDLNDSFSGVDPATYIPQNGAVYPGGNPGAQFRDAAVIIRADLGVEFIHIDMGGWDHHSGIAGSLQNRASTFDAAISAFMQDMGPLMSNVVILVMSEFGREILENGSAGTDHGNAGAMWVIGGAANGGQIHGSWPTVALSSLQGGRFLDPVNDFRDVVVEVLQNHMGGTLPQQVFPGHSPTPIGVF